MLISAGNSRLLADWQRGHEGNDKLIGHLVSNVLVEATTPEPSLAICEEVVDHSVWKTRDAVCANSTTTIVL